ncbi:ABC transporter [Candidatus Methylobacter favarea]|uniref:ABC transporter n=1 Tax=Candidatus Methylobacter favarea TaxID=2707345 RepID=A0A8S0W8P8_9GAMM|nr:ABC transporter transmembrane domain-containing protein [Candidatus Methylobacter favarea]CAA9889414.1 ABC transporter [Candidatus Methylobacter favarea]
MKPTARQSTASVSDGLKAFSRLHDFIKPYYFRILLAILALIIAAAATLALPVAVRMIIDKGFLPAQAEIINSYFLILLTIVLLIAVFAAIRFYLVMWLGERIVADIRSKVYQHVIRMEPQFFEITRTGEVLSRLTTDTTLVQTVVGAGFSVTLRSSIMLLGSLFMLAITSVQLTALILILVPLVILPLLVFGRKVRRLSRTTQDLIAESSAIAGETLSAVNVVQSFVLENFFSRRFESSVTLSFEMALTRLKARALLSGFAVLIIFSAIMGVIWIGAQLVIAGQMSIGELSQFLIYALIVATSTAALSEVWGDVQRAAGAMERLMELLNTQSALPAQAKPIAIKHGITHPIHFDKVGFNYPSRPEQQALTDFTLSMSPGETIALVGPSGAGKSTVFQLLLRFYDPQQGKIILGGVDISKTDIHQLREQIGIVPQETVIFAADVWENIRYGKLDASNGDIYTAAQAAAADEFIQKLPEGYSTFLGERGSRLSGGQRQRIAIARAILKNPPVLLLDEATSALDAESEKLVQEAMEKLMKNRTTLVIAHRLATVLKANRIVVMNHGKIVAIGKHQELLSQGGLYARLAALQFGDSYDDHLITP